MDSLPTTYRKLVATRPGKDYRSITRIVEAPLRPPRPGKILVRNRYAGVNASDINLTSGAYGSVPALPMDLGVEAVGTVAALGDGVTAFAPGDAVTYLRAGAYGEFVELDARWAFKVPRLSPDILPLVASGMTAAVGLHHVGEMRSGDTVLVTGAAGGTGQFAVQLAKLAGNHVVAVCGGGEKAALLARLGADRVVDHRREDLGAVLRAEYPKGVDLVYECVGGPTFDVCVDHLAMRGRLLIVGYMSEYQEGAETVTAPRLYTKLLWKSASVRGFISSMHPEAAQAETIRLIRLWDEGALTSVVDRTPFRGLDSIPDAIDHLYGGRSVGKVIVDLAEPPAAG